MGNLINLSMMKEVLGGANKTVETGAEVVKDWRNTNTERKKNAYTHEENMYQFKRENIVRYVNLGISALNSLTDSFVKINNSLGNREKIQSEAESAMIKELFLHQREMEKLRQEADKLCSELTEKERNGEFIREQLKAAIANLQMGYNRYMQLEDRDFFSEKNQEALISLNTAIVELTKESLKELR